MTTTVYYTDTTPPTAPSAMTGFIPDWNVVLTDGGSPATTLIRYALYADTDVWDGFTAWAYHNRVSANTNNVDYSDLVFAIRGTFSGLNSDTAAEDTMCVADGATTGNLGAYCI